LNTEGAIAGPFIEGVCGGPIPEKKVDMVQFWGTAGLTEMPRAVWDEMQAHNRAIIEAHRAAVLAKAKEFDDYRKDLIPFIGTAFVDPFTVRGKRMFGEAWPQITKMIAGIDPKEATLGDWALFLITLPAGGKGVQAKRLLMRLPKSRVAQFAKKGLGEGVRILEIGAKEARNAGRIVSRDLQRAGVATDLLQSVKHVNEDFRNLVKSGNIPERGNCLNCAIAADVQFSGVSARVSASAHQAEIYLTDIPKLFGKSTVSSTKATIVRELIEGGESASGIAIYREGSRLHAVNVVNRGGEIYFIDVANMGEISPPSTIQIEFLRTH
jgi:hypothetical protein